VTAYCSCRASLGAAANETFLTKNSFVSHIHRKKPKGRTMCESRITFDIGALAALFGPLKAAADLFAKLV
jgi:hypothetical protein